MFGGEGQLAVYGDGGPAGAQALGVNVTQLCQEAVSLRLGSGQCSDRQTEDTRVEYHRRLKKTEKDFVKNGKKERTKKENRVLKRAGKVR